MLFSEKCLNFGEKYDICGKLFGISENFFSYLGKTMVCPENFFDPLNGTFFILIMYFIVCILNSKQKHSYPNLFYSRQCRTPKNTQ